MKFIVLVRKKYVFSVSQTFTY